MKNLMAYGATDWTPARPLASGSRRSSLETVRWTVSFADANRFSPSKRRNLGTFKTRQAAEKHERAVQYFKRH
jgi:hypothetical protein